MHFVPENLLAFVDTLSTVLIYSAHTMFFLIFTLTPTFIFIPLLIQVTFSTIKFAFALA